MYSKGKRLLMGIAMLLLISVVLAACGDDSAPPTPPTGLGGPTQAANSQDNPSKSNSGPPMDSSTAGQVQKAVSSMAALKSYHLDIVTTDGTGTQTASTSADVDVSNNRLKMDANNAGQTTSVIAISDTTYVSTDGGKTYSASTSGIPLAAPVQGFVKMWSSYSPTDAQKATVKFAGNQQIDGVDTQRLSADIYNLGGLGLTLSGAESAKATGTIDLWITQSTPPTIPQMRVTTTVNRVFTISMFKWSKLNAPVNIAAPTK